MKSISGKRLLQILQNSGWYVVRIKGSHYRLKKKNENISLSIHGNEDLKIGLLKAIMKKANLTESDL